MTRNFKYAVTVLSLFALVATAFAAGPYFVVWRLQRAIERGDAATISSYVDFPRLRENLKGALTMAMTHGSDQGVVPTAGGQLIAGALVSPMVDAMLTPEALARWMRGELPATLPAQRSAAALTAPTTSMGYAGLSVFVVEIATAGLARPVELVFNRSGVSWRLSDIRLPL